MSRTKLYWICQLSGWIFLSMLNLIFIAFVKDINWDIVYLVLYLSVGGVLFTHLLRSVILKYKWINLSIGKGIILIFLSSIILGCLHSFIYAILGWKLNVFRDFTYFGSVLLGSIEMIGVILLWSLIYIAIHYFENYKKVEIESLVWEAAVKDFELKTLKSQLNPHFMFNAMNSIRSLIEENPERAKVALTKLSNILRYSLKMEKNETVPLKDEMQVIYDYLELETIRFEERLNYELLIDEKSENIEIPPMMIQTLVENGIKHGISKMTSGGKLIIETKILEGNLYIYIRNSGLLLDQALKESEGFGINNTKQRLMLLYGEKASFKLKNEKNNLVTAEIKIPLGGIIR